MKRMLIATNLETGEERIFDNAKEAAKFLYVGMNTIYNVLNGIKPSVANYVFRYDNPPARLSKKQAEIIVKMADNRLNVAAAARELEKHINTVVYHVQEVVKLTGKDPRDFHGMCELLPMAKAVLEEAEQ